jgi:tripeptidyl-peptidase-1
MGISVLAASGDDGVAGYDGCLNDDSQVVDDGTYFAPNFPTSCPYVTAVGATQLPTGAPVTHPETANFERIFSGGGFSNYFPRPAYQQTQVSSYLKSYPPPYSSKTFNASSRAYPDISANGANFVTAIDGLWHTVYGTSASTPVVGAMIALITEARLLAGKKPLGFLNPALYSAGFQGAYNDITNGTNPGCGTVGFNATAGWDPVTGLGTPRFLVLMQKFMALP